MKELRPYVILKAAASLDGRIETAAGESQWITSKESRELSRKMRTEVDAILVGIETVLKDNPRLTSHGTGRNPLRVILDSRLRVPPKANVLKDGYPTLIATSARNLASLRRFRARNASLIQVPRNGSGLDLNALLRELSARGVSKLLVEGGSKIHTAFLEKGLVNEVRLFLAPRLIGGTRARGFFEGSGVRRLVESLQVSNLRVRHVGPDILITGSLDNRSQKASPCGKRSR